MEIMSLCTHIYILKKESPYAYLRHKRFVGELQGRRVNWFIHTSALCHCICNCIRVGVRVGVVTTINTESCEKENDLMVYAIGGIHQYNPSYSTQHSINNIPLTNCLYFRFACFIFLSSQSRDFSVAKSDDHSIRIHSIQFDKSPSHLCSHDKKANQTSKVINKKVTLMGY